MTKDLTLSLDVTDDGHKAVVAVFSLADDQGLAVECAGTALCVPEDPFNDRIGVTLAVGRALRDAGRMMTREAMRATRQGVA